MKTVPPQILIALTAVLLVSAAVIGGRLTPSTTNYASPYRSPQPFMEGIYAAQSFSAPMEPIGGVIVPHHLVASESMAIGIKALEGQSFNTVVLLSPDHFFECPTLLCTTNGTFETLFGNVESAPATVQRLFRSNLVSDVPELFKQEHGIYAVLPFIEYYFPDVAIVPVVISQQAWKDKQEELLELFREVVEEQTVLVVSSDFSHYLTFDQAQAKDAATINVLVSGDLDAIASLHNPSESDCPNCLWTLLALAKERGFNELEVLKHTNAAEILGDLSAASTTSHFAIIYR